MCREWKQRGFKDNLEKEFLGVYRPRRRLILLNRYPPWFRDDTLHASHRSNLLRKDRDYYSRFGWNEPADLPYYWPVTKDAEQTPVQERIHETADS